MLWAEGNFRSRLAMGKSPMTLVSRSLFALTLFTAAIAGAARAKADTISTFSLNSALEYGTANGSFTVDTTTGVLNAGSVTATYNGQSETLGTLVSSSGSSGLYTIELTTASGGSGDTFYLDLPVSTLLNYGGGAIDTSNYNASHETYLYAYNTMDYATSGNLNLASTSATRTATGTAVTPEAASWVLMLTGTAMLAVVARRRQTMTETRAASA